MISPVQSFLIPFQLISDPSERQSIGTTIESWVEINLIPIHWIYSEQQSIWNRLGIPNDLGNVADTEDGPPYGTHTDDDPAKGIYHCSMCLLFVLPPH